MNNERLNQLIDRIAQRFQERMQRKTGWGRNEVQLELQKAISQALADFLDPPQQESA